MTSQSRQQGRANCAFSKDGVALANHMLSMCGDRPSGSVYYTCRLFASPHKAQASSSTMWQCMSRGLQTALFGPTPEKLDWTPAAPLTLPARCIALESVAMPPRYDPLPCDRSFTLQCHRSLPRSVAMPPRCGPTPPDRHVTAACPWRHRWRGSRGASSRLQARRCPVARSRRRCRSGCWPSSAPAQSSPACRSRRPPAAAAVRRISTLHPGAAPGCVCNNPQKPCGQDDDHDNYLLPQEASCVQAPLNNHACSTKAPVEQRRIPLTGWGTRTWCWKCRATAGISSSFLAPGPASPSL
jgi:hypothetical protein